MTSEKAKRNRAKGMTRTGRIWPRTIRLATGGVLIAVRQVDTKPSGIVIVEAADGRRAHRRLDENLWYPVNKFSQASPGGKESENE